MEATRKETPHPEYWEVWLKTEKQESEILARGLSKETATELVRRINGFEVLQKLILEIKEKVEYEKIPSFNEISELINEALFVL